MRRSEEQGQTRRPPSKNNAKKQMKTTEGKKTKDLFKKTENLKGTFHSKMDIIKDRNDKDLIEEIKRWKEYTEEQYKKKS